MSRYLVVGPGPVRPGVPPAFSVAIADVAEALVSSGHAVVVLDSAPDSALLWLRGVERTVIGAVDAEAVRRLAAASSIEHVWPGEREARVALPPQASVIDVVCASDGSRTALLAAFEAASPVALGDAVHRSISHGDLAVKLADRGVATVRGKRSERGFEVLAVDRHDFALYAAAGLVFGGSVGAVAGYLLAGGTLDEALSKARDEAAVPLDVTRTPDTAFDSWPGADRSLGPHPKTFAAALSASPPPVPAKTKRRVLVVGPTVAASGTSAAAIRLATREIARLGHEAVVASASEGADPRTARVHFSRAIDEVRAAEAPDDVLLGIGTPIEDASAPAPEDAIELHVVALADGSSAQVLGTFEHVERAAVHPDDAAAVFPSLVVPELMVRAAEEQAEVLARSHRGLVTARFAVTPQPSSAPASAGQELTTLGVTCGVTTHVLSVGLVLGVDVVAAAVRVMLGAPLDLGPIAVPPHVAVEEHAFPFAALGASDTQLDRRPRSTGSVLAIGENVPQAYARALAAMGVNLRRSEARGPFLLSSTEELASSLADVGRRLFALGFDLVATAAPSGWLDRLRVPHRKTDDPAAVARTCFAVVAASPNDAALRRAALVAGVTCFTTVDLARVAVAALEREAP